MKYLRALLDLLRDPFSTANRESLCFGAMFHGGIAAAIGGLVLVAWFMV